MFAFAGVCSLSPSLSLALGVLPPVTANRTKMTRLDISLNDGWTVTSECGKHAVPATLPKYALEALADAGVVPDPLVR